MSDSEQQEIEKLRREIRRHDILYYVENQPRISDREYDRLMQRLQELEEKHPEWSVPDSPTQRVGGKIADKFQPVEHRAPMLSLDNSYSLPEFQNFHDRVVKLLNKENISEKELQYVVELKIDGLGVTRSYDNGVFVRARHAATAGRAKTSRST